MSHPARFLVPLLAAAGLALPATEGAIARAQQPQHDQQHEQQREHQREQQQGESGETFVGNLVDLGGIAPGNTARFELHVERWDTAEEVARLAALQEEKGTVALQDALWERAAGYIRVDQALGYPVGLAFVEQGEGGGRTLYAVMDRPIQLYEIWRGLRTRDYPFAVAELTVDAQGNGSGVLHPVAKVQLSPRRIVIENYTAQPFRVLDVRRQE